eukprot:jgi/Mesen1/6651/ME000340S05815
MASITASSALFVSSTFDQCRTTRKSESVASLRTNTSSLSRAGESLLVVRAAKLPAGVVAPKEEPKLPAPLWGFTENAEVWNSRAAMIGFFGIILLEAVVHRGLLDLLGVEIGKGLDLPL